MGCLCFDMGLVVSDRLNLGDVLKEINIALSKYRAPQLSEIILSSV